MDTNLLFCEVKQHFKLQLYYLIVKSQMKMDNYKTLGNIINHKNTNHKTISINIHKSNFIKYKT